MGQSANLFFNIVSTIFLVLTLVVGVIVISVLTGSMDPPILAPNATEIPPTQAVLPTLTPSPGPSAVLTPTANTDEVPTQDVQQ